LTQTSHGAKNRAMQGIFRIARHLAFVALVMRALLPTGWMPSADGMTICSVETPAQQGEHGKAPGNSQDAHHDICPFSAAPHLASTPDVPQLALPVLHAFAAATDSAYAVAVSAYFTPQSPRAPPSIV